VPWRWHRPVPVVSMASQRRRQGSALPSIMGCDAGHDRQAGGSGPTTSPEQRSRHRVPRRRQSGTGDAALESRAARSDLGEGDYAAVGAGPLEPPVHAHTVRPTRLRLQPKRDNAGTGASLLTRRRARVSAGELWLLIVVRGGSSVAIEFTCQGAQLSRHCVASVRSAQGPTRGQIVASAPAVELAVGGDAHVNASVHCRLPPGGGEQPRDRRSPDSHPCCQANARTAAGADRSP
jgi:hypothetical protein